MQSIFRKALRNRIRLRIHYWYEKDLMDIGGLAGKLQPNSDYSFQVVPSTQLGRYKSSIPERFHTNWDHISSVQDHDAAIITYGEDQLVCYQTFTFNGPFNKEMNYLIRLRPKEVYFSTLRTFERYQGMGMASKCLIELQVYLKERGYQKGYIITKKENRSAQQVFKKCGWLLSKKFFVLRLWRSYYRVLSYRVSGS